MTLHTHAGQRIEIEDEPAACATFVAQLEALAASGRGQTASAPEPEAETRPYRGRTNRRHLVLEILRELADEGQLTPTLDQIKHRFLRRHPHEPVEHLDQVVRDLANKTDLVSRHEWGTFKLVK